MLEEEALTKQDAAREERQEELERTFSYDGYQVVRKELFAHLRDPAIVIRNDSITFNTACITGLENVVYVHVMFNILKGDMSIVGPRPALPREVEKYDDYQRQRLLVQPGLTCYWQIQPQRNSLSFDEWIELDIKYIRERSFRTDWKIIFGTIRAVIGMNGE